jgi:hypothetical protein
MQDRLDEQAREIGRLASRLRTALLDNAELAALKSQPSGVVLPEYKGGELTDPAGFDEGWDCCINEVSRLNSSPVSAGEPCCSCEPTGVFAIDGSGPFDCPDCGKKAAAQMPAKKAENHAALSVEGAAQVSAGGVDERAEVWDGKSLPYGWVAVQMLFDGPDHPEDFAYGPPRMMERLSGILERYYAARFAPKVEPVNTKGSRKALGAMNAKLRAKVGRLERELVALSADHSDQVREDWKLVPVEPTDEMIEAACKYTSYPHQVIDIYKAAIGKAPKQGCLPEPQTCHCSEPCGEYPSCPAAPSAGSQEQGE